MTDHRIKRGDSIEFDVGPVLKADGSVQDITGLRLRFTAKDRLDDLDAAAIIVGSTIDGRITITDGPGGYAHVEIPPSATSAFTTDRALHWDIQIAEPVADGTTKTLDSGKLIVERDVTRSA
jgi:hypothetical protein